MEPILEEKFNEFLTELQNATSSDSMNMVAQIKAHVKKRLQTDLEDIKNVMEHSNEKAKIIAAFVEREL